MNAPIKRVVKGETPTLLETEKANELIDRLNALGAIEIRQGTKNEVIYAGDRVVMTYKFPPDGWEVKEVTLCEDGEEKTYTFLVQAAT
tara:strand:- start:315 stop:578 length:264 start_codon:yes stop_codon:yes gene_type:complete